MRPPGSSSRPPQLPDSWTFWSATTPAVAATARSTPATPRRTCTKRSAATSRRPLGYPGRPGPPDRLAGHRRSRLDHRPGHQLRGRLPPLGLTRTASSPAVSFGLPAGTRGARASPALLGGRRAQGTVTGGLSGNDRALPARPGGRCSCAGPLTLLRGSGRLKPFRTQFSRGLPGQNRDSPAYPGEGFLMPRPSMRPARSPAAPCRARPVQPHERWRPCGTGRRICCGLADPGFEFDGRVLVELGDVAASGEPAAAQCR